MIKGNTSYNFNIRPIRNGYIVNDIYYETIESILKMTLNELNDMNIKNKFKLEITVINE